MMNAIRTKRRNVIHRRKIGALSLFSVGVSVSLPAPAYAMHISEGLLPASWALLWFAVAIPFVAWGLRDLKRRSGELPYFKPLVGLVGAAVFLISCMPIPVPTAGTCSHPSGTGLAAILIGPGLTVVVASIALTLQARPHAVSADGDRWIEASSFFQGMFTTALSPEAMLTEGGGISIVNQKGGEPVSLRDKAFQRHIKPARQIRGSGHQPVLDIDNAGRGQADSS